MKGERRGGWGGGRGARSATAGGGVPSARCAVTTFYRLRHSPVWCVRAPPADAATQTGAAVAAEAADERAGRSRCGGGDRHTRRTPGRGRQPPSRHPPPHHDGPPNAGRPGAVNTRVSRRVPSNRCACGDDALGPEWEAGDEGRGWIGSSSVAAAPSLDGMAAAADGCWRCALVTTRWGGDRRGGVGSRQLGGGSPRRRRQPPPRDAWPAAPAASEGARQPQHNRRGPYGGGRRMGAGGTGLRHPPNPQCGWCRVAARTAGRREEWRVRAAD